VTISVQIAPANMGKAELQLGKKVIQAITRRVIREVAPAQLLKLRRRSVQLDIRYRFRFALGWAIRHRGWHTVEIYNRAKHAVFVENGRRRGKMPPIKAIETWLRYKSKNVVKSESKMGITVTRRGGRSPMKSKQIRSRAFLIARAIGRRGIKPRRVLTHKSTQAEIRAAFTKKLKLHYGTAMSIVYAKGAIR